MSSLVAAANWERGTNSVMVACQVGDSVAKAIPTAKVNANSRPGGISPSMVRVASAHATAME